MQNQIKMFLRLKYYTFNKNIPFLSRQLFTFAKDQKSMEKQVSNQNEIEQNQPISIQHEIIPNYSSRENNKTFKAKCGIFFGYNGQKYLGMQYQRDTENTIENILHKMLMEGGFILKTNQDELRRIGWSRAARTDKRVHALCNGISLKLEIAEKFTNKQGERDIDFDKLRIYFNSQLPIDIRIFSIMRVAKSFDMRHDALTRVYNYIIPLNIFQKYEDFKSGKIPSLEQEVQIVEKLNSLCKCYLGTHNFHNFTKGYKQNDPKCDRYMISMKAESVEKEVFERYWDLHKEESEKRDISKQRYVRFTLIGQSFIYHQIRKMIGLIVKIFVQGLEGQSTIKQAFKPSKFDLYLAPGEGLYLNRMTFESYNKRRQKNNEKVVQLNEEDEERILKFRQYLESQILHHEIQQKVFTQWLTNKFEFKVQQNEDEQAEISMEQQEQGNNTEKKQEQNEGEAKEQNNNKKSKNFKKQFNKRK